MNRTIEFTALTLAMCSGIGSAAGTLKGVVTDASTSKPLSGATVTLVEKGLLDTTDANGYFAFVLPTSIQSRGGIVVPHYEAGRGIVFSNGATGPVSVEVLDVSGKVVRTPIHSNLVQGTWSVPLNKLPLGVYFCKISQTSGTSSFRFFTGDNQSQVGTSGRIDAAGMFAARGLATPSNTVVTSFPGYISDTTTWDETTSDSLSIQLRTTGSPPPLATARTIIPFDTAWLFNKGDASGADKASFADGSWRKLNVPHDWSIEGPYDQNATTTGTGGYLPAGIGWYRKHFNLPSALNGSRVFIEFDGIMANGSVYLNGTLLGTRPYGYMTVRYEITTLANFGTTENVISVKADNSAQPASRWYTGAGIYRHVRIIATNPVHLDKWATFVTTPTTTAAHITTTVVNQGAAAQSVSVRVVLIDPSGTKLSPIVSAVKSVPASGSADFTIDVPVANAKLWSLETPNMYQLVTTVLSGTSSLDDEVTPFGIRTIEYNVETGFYLNGKNLKMKGVCLHHEVGGLGAAVPLRAWQRRLAILKSLGVNAIRTSHNPFDPGVLDLMDRMGFLVMDEFFDVWIGHKEAADYATYFPKWYQTDATDIVRRDRNHPGIVIYSIGNEIRDGISTRLPYTKTLVNICHANDPTRPVTQALFRPKDAGDYPGNTLDIFDVFGVNYRNAELDTATSRYTPHHAGISTEMGANPGVWSSFYLTHPRIVGEFIWTGAYYLGEADASWPVVVGTNGTGGIFGMIDRVGGILTNGYDYQAIWSTNPVVKPRTVTSGATKVLLTVDHPSIATDFEDVAYVKATIVDGSGNKVSTANNAVTFQVTGTAGKIVAVDNGSTTGETYRGNVRTAFQGDCYAMVQMTSPGSITISATAGSFTGSSVTVTGVAGSYVPCTGKCD